MNVVGVIQARMGSSRLPGKALAPLVGDLPLLSALVKRVELPTIQWWLATTSKSEDTLLDEWGRALKLEVFRGDVEDVLSRFAAVVRRTEADWVVRVTGDDPFMDRGVVARGLEQAECAAPTVDLIGDLGEGRRLPLGYAPQFVRGEAILRLDRELPRSHSYHRVHVTSALIGMRSSQLEVADWPARADWRWTVDTIRDLRMAQETFRLLGDAWSTSSYAEIVSILDHRPDITGANAGVRQKSLTEG